MHISVPDLRGSIGTTEPAHSPAIVRRLFLSGVVLIFFWFVFQVVFYSFSVLPGVSPDEFYHLLFCESVYQTPGISIKDTDLTASLGPLSTRPYLYHLIMGKALYLKPAGISALAFLRCLNIILSLFTFYFAFLLVRLLTDDSFVQLAVLLFLSNVTMFVFLAGMLSYDNLVNSLSAMSFYFLVRFTRSGSLTYLFIVILSMLLGLLVKETYALVVLLQLALLLCSARMIRRRSGFRMTTPRASAAILVIAIAVLLTLNVKLYGGNLLQYRTFIPRCDQVLPLEDCMKSARYQRDLALQETVEMRVIMHPLRYVKLWVLHMEATSLGVLGHKLLIKTNLDLLPYNILFTLSLLLILSGHKATIVRTYVLPASISLIFIMILFAGNFALYNKYRFFELATQGRYLFPVIVPLAYTICYPLFLKQRFVFKILLLSVMTLLFVHGGFCYFLSHADSSWFGLNH